MNGNPALLNIKETKILEDIISISGMISSVLSELEGIIKETQAHLKLPAAALLMGLPEFYISSVTEENLAIFVSENGKYKINEFSLKKVSALFEKDGNIVEHSSSFSEIRKAGICFDADGKLKSEWKHFRKQMLWAKTVNDALRMLSPHLVKDEIPRARERFDRVPAGKHEGRPWNELSDDMLKAALVCCNSEFTDEHREAIKNEFMNRRMNNQANDERKYNGC